MISAKLLIEYAGLSPGTIGTVIGGLQLTGPVWVQWQGRNYETLMRRYEIELILPLEWDGVYTDSST